MEERELIFKEENEYILQTYKRYPLIIEKGKGVYLWDNRGFRYLDFVSGLAVCSLGHSHPKIIDTLKRQGERLIHTSNLFYTKPQIELAKKLTSLSFKGRVFFGNSGAEANEAAIKLARKYGKNRGGKFEIITMENSFHGRTLATLTATAQKKFQKGFDPLPEGFKYCRFNDIDDLMSKITPYTAAILIEPIQGEGGVNIAKSEYLSSLREICSKNKILLIFDEVQTGIGRTGEMFAFQNYNLTPDVFTLAKALGNGFPIGAMVVKEEFSDCLSYGEHASTFGGNPLTCEVANTTLDIIEREKILNNVKKVSKYIFTRLNWLKEKYSFIKEVRGKGLMIALQLDREGNEIVQKAILEGLLINCTCENILRLLPPLIITNKEIDTAIEILDRVFSSL
jgi:acetylornithine/N-succinyldiaminopimelate aminotransferase